MDNQRSQEDVKDTVSTEESNIELRCVGRTTERNHSHSETEVVGDSLEHTVDLMVPDMESLGELFEHSIQEVSRLEEQRDDLIEELLRLQDPLLRVLDRLRGKLVEARRQLSLALLDYTAVYEEVQQGKRKLFVTARDCIQMQVTLAAQEYDVSQSAVTQEELKAQIQSLTQDLSQQQKVHQDQLHALRDQAWRPHRPRALSDVSLCRQASARLQRRLSCSVQALEGWYEPRLTALLRRRQAGEDALRKSREQSDDMRARLGPLREEVLKLEVQRSSLEQRITLMDAEREESLQQHKETANELQETLRELQLEFDVLRKSQKDLEDLKNNLLAELVFLRGCDESSEPTAENHL